MKKWIFSRLGEDFWTSVIMTATDCPLPFLSELRGETERPAAEVAVRFEGARQDSRGGYAIETAPQRPQSAAAFRR